MKHLLAFILLMLASFTAGAATNAVVIFDYKNFMGAGGSAMDVVLQPTDEPRTNGTAIVTGQSVTRKTSTAGIATFTNVLWGTNAFYRADLQSPGKVRTIYILVPTNTTQYAADLLVTVAGSGSITDGYSKSQANAAFIAKNNGIGTNISFYTRIGLNGVSITNWTDISGSGTNDGVTVAAGTNVVAVTNGSVVTISASPTINTNAVIAFSTNVHVGGTFTANSGSIATLNADVIEIAEPIPPNAGGTGRSNLTSGTLLIGNGTNAPSLLSGASDGQVVTWNGSAWVSSNAPVVTGGGVSVTVGNWSNTALVFVEGLLTDVLTNGVSIFSPSNAISPTFNPSSGSVPLSVTMTSAGNQIYWTTNGNTPTTNLTSVASGSSVTISSTNFALKAIAWTNDGRLPSTVTSAYYTNIPPFIAVQGLIGGVGTNEWVNDNHLVGGYTMLNDYAGQQVYYTGTLKRGHVWTIGSAGNVTFKHYRPIGANVFNHIADLLMTNLSAGTNEIYFGTVSVEEGDTIGMYGDEAGQWFPITTGSHCVFAAGNLTDDAYTFSGASATRLSLALYGDAPQVAFVGDSILTPYPLGYATGSGNTEASGAVSNSMTWKLSKEFAWTTPYINLCNPNKTLEWINTNTMRWATNTPATTLWVHCGVNDIAAGFAWSSALTNLNSIRTKFAGSLIVSEILPWTLGSDANNLLIRTWNTNLAVWCATSSATLFQIHDSMGQTRGSTGQLDDLKTAYDSDGVHLTTAGKTNYAARAKLILP